MTAWVYEWATKKFDWKVLDRLLYYKSIQIKQHNLTIDFYLISWTAHKPTWSQKEILVIGKIVR